MARYKPKKPFITPMLLYPCTGTETVRGVVVKHYATDGIPFNGSFSTYGGTERTVNGVHSVEDTAVVETWYRPEFASSGRVALAANPARLYEIQGEPEDIEERHLYTHLRLSRVKGGA